jgi:hypothetical protein
MNKRTVILEGTIKGEGRECACKIRALEVSHPGLPPAYAQFNVVSTSEHLPDGVYELTAGGITERVRYSRGVWLSAMP